MKHTRFYRAKHQLAEVRTELVGQAIALLRWWADDAGDDPDVLEHITRSLACADALEVGWLKRRGLKMEPNAIHQAGALVDGVQVCTRCGYVLTDYRGAMVPDGTPPLRGWADGAAIEVFEGNPRHSLVVDERPNCREE